MFLFKKKLKNSGLKYALDLDLISQKEYLELTFKRAEKELENYIKIKPVKIKVRNKK